MKILHVYKTSLPESHGGVEKFIDNLCRKTSEQGFKNTVYTLSKTATSQVLSYNNYTIHQEKQNLFILSTGISFDAINNYRNVVSKFDLIHYHFPNPFGDLLHIISFNKKPYIISYHSDIINQKISYFFYKPLERYFLSNSKYIITSSKNYLEKSRVLQQHIKRVKVIPYGIDLGDYPSLDKDIRNKWAKKIGTNFFLFIGVTRYYKGLDYLLSALKDQNISLVIAGKITDDKLLKFTKKFKLEVVFLGEISEEDKVALFDLSFCFIFPSHLRTESFGISLLEAAAFGKPLISCEIGTGTSFINLHGITGLVVKKASPNSLLLAMRYLVDNPEKAKLMGKAAAKRAKTYFSLEHQTTEYIKIYNKALNSRV